MEEPSKSAKILEDSQGVIAFDSEEEEAEEEEQEKCLSQDPFGKKRGENPNGSDLEVSPPLL